MKSALKYRVIHLKLQTKTLLNQYLKCRFLHKNLSRYNVTYWSLSLHIFAPLLLPESKLAFKESVCCWIEKLRGTQLTSETTDSNDTDTNHGMAGTAALEESQQKACRETQVWYDVTNVRVMPHNQNCNRAAFLCLSLSMQWKAVWRWFPGARIVRRCDIDTVTHMCHATIDISHPLITYHPSISHYPSHAN